MLQTVKGGVSETRIEKRIVITGDTEIDHDKVRDVNHGESQSSLCCLMLCWLIFGCLIGADGVIRVICPQEPHCFHSPSKAALNGSGFN